MTPLATPAPSSASASMDMFLRLLTAQLKNQDPLSPMDGTKFAQQLATFSNVEQQIKTGEKLERIVQQLSGSLFNDAASIVGRRAGIVVDHVDFSGSPVELQASLPEGAEHGVVSVKDADGSVVARIPVSGNGSVEWDGRTVKGTIATPGTYGVSVQAVQGDGEFGELGELRANRLITAVELTGEGIRLVADDGKTIDMSALRQFK